MDRSSLWKFYPRKYSDCDRDEQRAIDQTIREMNRTYFQEHEFSDSHNKAFFRSVAEKMVAADPEKARASLTSPDIPPHDSWQASHIPPEVPNPTEFRPYGNGSLVQGPELTEHYDGKNYGDSRKFPGAGQSRDEAAAAAAARKAGTPAHLPNAPMTGANGVNNLQFHKHDKDHPRLESGEPAYGNPSTFPGRDEWRSPFRGGLSVGPSGHSNKR